MERDRGDGPDGTANESKQSVCHPREVGSIFQGQGKRRANLEKNASRIPSRAYLPMCQMMGVWTSISLRTLMMSDFG